MERSRRNDNQPTDTLVGQPAGDRASGATLQSATHAPAPRVVVEQEVRSIVLSAEVDDDLTPPRGTPAPAEAVSVRPGRLLTPYSRSSESTRRAARGRVSSRPGTWFGLSTPTLALVAAGGAAVLAALAAIGWMLLATAEPSSAPVGSASAAVSAAHLPQTDDALEPPVSADDLPLERN